MALSIPVIYGSVRSARVGIRAARYVAGRLAEAGHDATLVDPLEHALPLLDKRLSDYAEGEAPAGLARLAARFRGADAFVIVSGEYNHLPPPALLNLLDHFRPEFALRPVGLATYSRGAYGGARADVHLRDFVGALGMLPLPTALSYPRLGEALAEDGAPTADHADALARRFGRFERELAFVAEALRDRRRAAP